MPALSVRYTSRRSWQNRGMDIRIEEIDAQPVVGIRMEMKQAEIGDRVGELLGEMMPQLGPQVAGAPLALYHTWENDRGEVEVAIPVQPGAEAAGRMQHHDLPGGRAVVMTHVGPYDNLQQSWDAINAWIKDNDVAPRAAPWEQYVSDCSVVPPEKLETRIVWPID